MKLHLLLFCLIVTFGFTGPVHGIEGNSTEGQLRSSFMIDVYDTVVFDISQSVMGGNQVSFPVYIQTDDTINALDFSLRLDETNFSLDTIINLTTYLQSVYNIAMGTLYFTSYSLQEIEHNIPLISIRLNMIGHYLCSSDLDSVLVYLNGDPCSVKIIECLSDHVNEGQPGDQPLSIFPNPSSGLLNVIPSAHSIIQLLDIKTSRVIFQAAGEANHQLHISTSELPAGVYLVRIINDLSVSLTKVIVN